MLHITKIALKFWLVLLMMAIAAFPANARQLTGEDSSVAKAARTEERLRLVPGPKKAVPLVAILEEKKSNRWPQTITIGRLELRRSDRGDLHSEHAVPFDRLEALRTANRWGPAPAISISFSLHWKPPSKTE